MVLNARESLLVNIDLGKIALAVDPECCEGEGNERTRRKKDVEMFDCKRVESVLDELS